MIILPETTEDEGYAVAQRIRKAVEETGFAIYFSDSAEVSVTEKLSISIGLSFFDSNIKNKRELVEFADAALYAAKSKGRNAVLKYRDVAAQKRAKEAS